MRIPLFLPTALAFVLLLCDSKLGSCDEVTSRAKPNIVFIMADELAFYELGHMGNPYIKTPKIDALAREGIRLPNALAGFPGLCVTSLRIDDGQAYGTCFRSRQRAG
ncbi:MAG: hypothetical protein AAGG44_13050 [Planctomycetota bacterium]